MPSTNSEPEHLEVKPEHLDVKSGPVWLVHAQHADAQFVGWEPHVTRGGVFVTSPAMQRIVLIRGALHRGSDGVVTITGDAGVTTLTPTPLEVAKDHPADDFAFCRTFDPSDKMHHSWFQAEFAPPGYLRRPSASPRTPGGR